VRATGFEVKSTSGTQARGETGREVRTGSSDFKDRRCRLSMKDAMQRLKEAPRGKIELSSVQEPDQPAFITATSEAQALDVKLTGPSSTS